ncbi:hypothetical protein PAXRUDRAFT_647543 [Paxillus rubicundulus Ve08.2h10]|uniref:Uncharacterized protein n=1 Tax=Paxillus rubicundulus Ve08.2h10 TaxID=930991 RepID=A0A0D0D3R0_9AGAM|nr:hypothetical protein PAXRUDRAFT_647543 [Paxillus rubicundulus Ve08.2h10]
MPSEIEPLVGYQTKWKTRTHVVEGLTRCGARDCPQRAAYWLVLQLIGRGTNEETCARTIKSRPLSWTYTFLTVGALGSPRLDARDFWRLGNLYQALLGEGLRELCGCRVDLFSTDSQKQGICQQ